MFHEEDRHDRQQLRVSWQYDKFRFLVLTRFQAYWKADSCGNRDDKERERGDKEQYSSYRPH
jgi:hypothetical protein